MGCLGDGRMWQRGAMLKVEPLKGGEEAASRGMARRFYNRPTIGIRYITLDRQIEINGYGCIHLEERDINKNLYEFLSTRSSFVCIYLLFNTTYHVKSVELDNQLQRTQKLLYLVCGGIITLQRRTIGLRLTESYSFNKLKEFIQLFT